MNTKFVQRALPLLLVTLGGIAHAQNAEPHGYMQEHGFSLSAGATSPFDHTLTADPTGGTYTIPTPTGGVINTTVSGEQQYTTDSVGFLASLQFHPKPWAGVEFNYGFSHFSERYGFNYTAATTAQTLGINTDMHEATGAYQFHPKHIPFQPFVNIGGGALDFSPRSNGNYQWRGAGLMEAGFDLPTHNRHIGFRIEGRGLFYRAPNFGDPAISTRSWVATVEPSISTYYRF